MTSWRDMVLLLVLAYAAAAGNAALCSQISVGQAAPNLLAALAMAWVTVGRGESRFVVAAAIGLASDLCSGQRLGMGMACYLFVGFGLEAVQLRQAYHHPALRLGTALPAVVLLQLTLACCEWLQSDMSRTLASLSGQALAMGVYTAAVCGLTLAVVHSAVSQRQFS